MSILRVRFKNKEDMHVQVSVEDPQFRAESDIDSLDFFFNKKTVFINSVSTGEPLKVKLNKEQGLKCMDFVIQNASDDIIKAMFKNYKEKVSETPLSKVKRKIKRK